MPSLLEVEQFFLEAANNTWAAGMEKSTIPELPGSKVLRYERGGLRYVDMYLGSGERSFGQTTIYAGADPFWMMQFYGEYPKHLTPLVKEALRAQYELGKFNGGRGPAHYPFFRLDDNGNPPVYHNAVARGSAFRDFQGDEWVENLLTHEVLGWHRYSGFALQQPATREQFIGKRVNFSRPFFEVDDVLCTLYSLSILLRKEADRIEKGGTCAESSLLYRVANMVKDFPIQQAPANWSWGIDPSNNGSQLTLPLFPEIPTGGALARDKASRAEHS